MNLAGYIRQNWLPLLMVFIPAGLFLGPLPHNSAVYYGWLITSAVLTVAKCQRVSITTAVFLIVCAFSIIFGNADPLFRSWERFGIFALLLISYFHVFQSDYFDDLCSRAFRIMLWVIIFTSVGSFVCYFGGINYMERNYNDVSTIDVVGRFGGLTYHSMMLGPICAIALTALIWILVEWAETKKAKIIVACAAFASMCGMMLTASRGGNIAGAVGVLLILFLKYRKRLDKILQIVIAGIVLATVLSPVYMPYADKVLKKQWANEAAGSTFASREDRWEHRWEEFSEYPVFGYGFGAVDTKYKGEYMPSTGIVEPGSSWLAILSMTGIVGAACFIILLWSTVSKLYHEYNCEDDTWALLHLGILAVFAVHFFAEGYVFAGGGAMCFLFWFFLGCARSYVRNPSSHFSVKEIAEIEND